MDKDFNIFEEIKWCAENCKEKDKYQRLAAHNEEVGELATAFLVEDGIKQKILSESSKREAADVIVTALTLFYSTGGSHQELIDIMREKITKWKGQLKPKPKTKFLYWGKK